MNLDQNQPKPKLSWWIENNLLNPITGVQRLVEMLAEAREEKMEPPSSLKGDWGLAVKNSEWLLHNLNAKTLDLGAVATNQLIPILEEISSHPEISINQDLGFLNRIFTALSEIRSAARDQEKE